MVMVWLYDVRRGVVLFIESQALTCRPEVRRAVLNPTNVGVVALRNPIRE